MGGRPVPQGVPRGAAVSLHPVDRGARGPPTITLPAAPPLPRLSSGRHHRQRPHRRGAFPLAAPHTSRVRRPFTDAAGGERDALVTEIRCLRDGSTTEIRGVRDGLTATSRATRTDSWSSGCLPAPLPRAGGFPHLSGRNAGGGNGVRPAQMRRDRGVGGRGSRATTTRLGVSMTRPSDRELDTIAAAIPGRDHHTDHEGLAGGCRTARRGPGAGAPQIPPSACGVGEGGGGAGPARPACDEPGRGGGDPAAGGGADHARLGGGRLAAEVSGNLAGLPEGERASSVGAGRGI